MEYRKYIFCIPTFIFALQTSALDWPQFQGPNRDAVSLERGILKTWPESGLKVIWRKPLGEGFSGISVSGGKLFTMFDQGADQFVICMDAGTGKEIWRARLDSRYESGRGNGPRSTPTVEAERVFTLTPRGLLHAFDAKTGKILWQHNLQQEFGAKGPDHGFSTSPLVERDLLLIEAGAPDNKAILAFNKTNGKLVWSALSESPGYSSPTAVTVNGLRQILFFTGTALISISPKGEHYWSFPWQTRYDINVATPILVPPNKIFISSAYDTGAALVEIKMKENRPVVEEIWRSKVMKNHFHSSVRNGDYIYGFDNAVLKCIHAATGEEKWVHSGFGKGSLILAEGHLIVLGERGQLGVVEASPDAYKEKAQWQALDGLTWAGPTLANGKLYLRNTKEIVCLNINE
jgi:outer membrane protein assembly factor BamB